jgi:hypothetical protein
MLPPVNACLPLVFGYRDLIEGEGFVAVVEVYGRALLVQGDEEIWMNGVNPGGLAGGGGTRREALFDFRSGYQSVLFDLAEAAADFTDFQHRVEAFFHQTNRPNEADWTRALEQVRAGKIEVDWLAKELEAEKKLRIDVHLIHQPTARENALPREAIAA